MIQHAIGSWTTTGLLTSNDQIKLVNKLNEKLQGSDFNASVFLGESHMTLKMLADSAIRIAKAVHHIKKLDVAGAARSLFEGTTRAPLKKHDWKQNRPGSGSAKNAANLWLELQYGWLPLLNDAEECAKSLAHYLGTPLFNTYRVTVRRETRRFVLTNSPGPYAINTVVRQGHQRGLIALIGEKPTALAQLGLLDPELVAWNSCLSHSWPIGSYQLGHGWKHELQPVV